MTNVKPWVYIAGPYSSDPVPNTEEMCLVWNYLQTSYPEVVFINPLWSHYQHVLHPQEYGFWIQYDLDLIRTLANSSPGLIYRRPGESSGADGEVALAKELGIPICNTLSHLEVELLSIRDREKVSKYSTPISEDR